MRCNDYYSSQHGILSDPSFVSTNIIQKQTKSEWTSFAASKVGTVSLAVFYPWLISQPDTVGQWYSWLTAKILQTINIQQQIFTGTSTLLRLLVQPVFLHLLQVGSSSSSSSSSSCGLSSADSSYENEDKQTNHHHHNCFTALLDFMVQGKINRGRHTDHPAGFHSIRTNQCPPPQSPIFYRPDALPAAQPTASKHWRQLAHSD